MKLMKRQFLTAVALVLLSASWGCGVNSRNQMVETGRAPLDAKALYTLVAGRNLHLSAIDFDAQVLFQEKGRMSALSRTGEKDSGSWDITSDNLLCLDFSHWYFSDLKCYSVIAEEPGGPYIFFTENGARYYRAEQLATIPEALKNVGVKEKRSSYLKERNSRFDQDSPATEEPAQVSAAEVPAPEPSKAELKHLLANTARNCPACDLTGADLSQADLIGAKLAGAKLSGANLHGANLRRADLSGADLHDADLKAANLPGANLTGCNLTNADLTGANLIKANLTGATIKGTLLSDTLTEGTIGIK